MHDIRFIRENFETFKKKISKRNNTTNIDNILDFDKKNRELIQEKEYLEKQKKDMSKSKDEKMFQKSKEISLKIKKLSDEQLNIKSELDKLRVLVRSLNFSESSSQNFFGSFLFFSASLCILRPCSSVPVK